MRVCKLSNGLKRKMMEPSAAWRNILLPARARWSLEVRIGRVGWNRHRHGGRCFCHPDQLSFKVEVGRGGHARTRRHTIPWGMASRYSGPGFAVLGGGDWKGRCTHYGHGGWRLGTRATRKALLGRDDCSLGRSNNFL
jgi:hypothetical protein